MVDTPKSPSKQAPSGKGSVLYDNWRQYYALGFSPIGTHPVGTIIGTRERDKSPVLYRWQEFCDHQPDPREIDQTLLIQPRAQIGVACGYDRLVALDVDTEDPEIKRCVLKFMAEFFPNAPLRIGNRQRVGAYLFQWNEDNPPWLRYVDRQGGTIFELLGTGRQIIMPPSMHHTKVPYEMSDGEDFPPPVSELPILNMAYVKLFASRIRDAGFQIDQSYTNALCDNRPTPAELEAYLKFIPDKKAVKHTIEYLTKQAPIAIHSPQIKIGHHTACKVWHRCADIGCPVDNIVELMWIYWNPNCQPPWEEYEGLYAEVKSLINSRRSPLGINNPDRLGPQYCEMGNTASMSEDGEGAEKPSENDNSDGDPWKGVHIDNNDAIAGVPCLIKNPTHGVVLPKRGLAMLGGQSGSGKTFVFINLAVALTTKGSFFGIPVRERVAVLVLAAEGQEDILGRIRAARAAAGIDEALPIFWISKVPNLADEQQIIELTDRIKKLNEASIKRFGIRIGLIAIDTVAASTFMKDENSNSEVSIITAFYRVMSMRTGALVMPIHHFGKNIESGPRGASAWKGNLDIMFSISQDNGTHTLAITKNRFGMEGPIADFELHKHRVGTDAEDGTPIETCWLRPLITDEAKIIAEAKVASAMKENEIVLREIVKGGGLLRQTELMQALGWGRGKLDWALKRLATAKLATNPNRRWAATPQGLALIKRLNDDQEFRAVKLREEERNRKRD